MFIRYWDREFPKPDILYHSLARANFFKLSLLIFDQFWSCGTVIGLGSQISGQTTCRITPGELMQTMWQDLRYGARMLVRNPGFTLIAVITLALGIGANTTIFSFINGLVLRPIPGVREPKRLVAVYTSDYSSGPYGTSSYLDYVDFRDQAEAFSGLAAYAERMLILTGGDEAERLRGV